MSLELSQSKETTRFTVDLFYVVSFATSDIVFPSIDILDLNKFFYIEGCAFMNLFTPSDNIFQPTALFKDLVYQICTLHTFKQG